MSSVGKSVMKSFGHHRATASGKNRRRQRGLGSLARKPKYLEVTTLRLLPGTAERIDQVLGQFEDRADFMRLAIEEKIALREAEAAAKKKKHK